MSEARGERTSIRPSEAPGGLDRLPTKRSRQLSARVITALIGLAGVTWAEILPPGLLQSVLADIGFVGLVVAAALVLLIRSPQTTTRSEHAQDPQVAIWRWTILGLGLAGALIIQIWFQSGTAIARGDVPPPIGTAWVGRIFSTFGWSGGTLGAPTNNQGLLPWATVSWVTDRLGGSGALAQRIWLSLLVAAILMAAGALTRSLRLSPMAGVVVALLYFFNPMTMSQVGFNDVFLTAMVLVAALAAAVISYGNCQIRLWQLGVVFIVAAPFVGYAYNNPPVVGMLALTTGVTPLLAWTRFGRDAARRSFLGVLIGGTLLVGASAFWLIPSWVALASVASGNLSALSAWGFTESRATLTNGLWLNATWGWSFSEYFPYAAAFGRFPLDLVPPLVPLIAFSGLALRHVSSGFGHGTARLRGLLSLGVLGVIFLSTGTRPPGNLLFDPLYHLPHGWLLREPGRFLIVAALGYALLAGLLVDQLHKPMTMRLPAVRRLFGQRGALRLSSSALVAVTIITVALIASFPLWTGATVAGPVQGFPSDHVKIPTYWDATVHYLNSSSSPRGSLLVLPPDDFYQMPYTWYYGNDGFIANALDRHVVEPSPQGYYTVSAELLNATQFEATAILDHNWNEASRILTAIGTPILLVRGDIETDFSGRSIVSPAALAAALVKDPEMELIYHNGRLSLYELRAAYRQAPTNFATVNTSRPDLHNLSLIPRRTVLVTSAPRPGHIALFQLPSSDTWQSGSTSLSTQLTVPVGWNYSVTPVGSGLFEGAKVTIVKTFALREYEVRIQVPLGRSLISDGNFSAGTWGPVGNCNGFQPIKPPEVLRASTIAHVAPGGASALELTASIDSACVGKTLSWHGGAVRLSLWERSLLGAPTRLCVWEEPINRCAALAPLPVGKGWNRYTTAFRPDSGTTKILLFLYADAVSAGKPSSEQYAGVTVRPLSAVPNVVVGTPTMGSTPGRIVTFGTGYSPQWIGPSGAKHVVVDGMRNGWIISSTAATRIVPDYLATSHELLDEALLTAAMALITIALWWTGIKRNYIKVTRSSPDLG